MVVDALSRIEEHSNLYSIAFSILAWLEESHLEWQEDDSIKHKMQNLKEGKSFIEHWEWKRDIICYKCKILVCLQS